jgi:hypothetical protein
MYFLGEQVERDYAQAAHWLTFAALQEKMVAANTLGVLYQHGFGVEKDMVESLRWFKTAAEAGNAKAQANLGSLYFTGDGVPQDLVAAYEWLKRSSLQEEALGTNMLVDLKKGMTPAQIAEGERRASVPLKQ